VVSNKEARAIGYVDKIHYKHYPYMSEKDYLSLRNGKIVDNSIVLKSISGIGCITLFISCLLIGIALLIFSCSCGYMWFITGIFGIVLTMLGVIFIVGTLILIIYH